MDYIPDLEQFVKSNSELFYHSGIIKNEYRKFEFRLIQFLDDNLCTISTNTYYVRIIFGIHTSFILSYRDTDKLNRFYGTFVSFEGAIFKIVKYHECFTLELL